MAKLKSKSKKSRIEQLEALKVVLAEAIDDGPGARDLAQLAKQYRETIRELDELKGGSKDDDELGAILSQRHVDGKPGAVR